MESQTRGESGILLVLQCCCRVGDSAERRMIINYNSEICMWIADCDRRLSAR